MQGSCLPRCSDNDSKLCTHLGVLNGRVAWLQAQVQGHWLSVCAVVPVPQRAIFVVPTAQVRRTPRVLLGHRTPLACRVSSAMRISVH